MSTEIKLTGGAQIGWVHASFPFARLTATAQQLSLTGLLGSYRFSPDQVAALEPYGWLLSNGIRIVHTNASLPEKMIFLSWRGSRGVIEEIENLGFHPSASPESVPTRDGTPWRWSFIGAVVLLWIALFSLDDSMGHKTPGLFADAAIALLVFASVAVERSAGFRSVALKPGRHATEVRPFLRLIQLVGGILLLGPAIQYFFFQTGT